MVEEIDCSEWYYIIRTGTNEKWCNSNGEINVCKSYHLSKLLKKLNTFGNYWEAISIADYNKMFRNVGV